MKTYSGFTIIELMITLAVISVVAAIGLPQIQGLTASNRLTGQINTLARDLAFARSEAVRTRSRIQITSTGGTTWETGWSITNLTDASTLRTTSAFSSGTPDLDSTVGTITYLPDGSTLAGANFALCDNRSGNYGKQITLLPTGRSSLATQVTCP